MRWFFPAVLMLALSMLPAFASGVASKDGQFGSVGLQVVPTAEGTLAVLRVVPDTPAAAQGMKAGDLIIQIDDFPLAGSEFAKVVAEHLWGPVGSSVRLTFLRPGVTGKQVKSMRRIAADPGLIVAPSAGTRPPAEQKQGQ